MKRSSKARLQAVALAAAAGAVAWMAPSRAHAQMVHVPGSDWRQADRRDAILANAKAQRWMFELRFGPYSPAVDSAFNGATPFADIFGLDCSTGIPTPSKKVAPRFYVGVEANYLPVRIPYVGGLGVGAGWGFTSFSNTAQYAASGTGCSPETTNLTIMPMYGVAVLRVDELMRRSGLPIVPYGKLGVGLGFWRASTNAGLETWKGHTPTVNGMGLSPSLHFALGGAFALNFLEPRSSARLEQSGGIGHAYLFGEWMNNQISLSTKSMVVGTSTFVGGLAADF